MASRDTVRERFEALAQQMLVRGRQTHPDERRLRWWCLTWRLGAVLALGFTLASPSTVQAKTFHCGAGDVQCLIDAIHDANANGQQNTIRLKAGTYALTTVDNDTEGPNGLPSITSVLTLRGAGAETTRLERVFTGLFSCSGDEDEPAFRILHVALTGVLTLKGLTLRGGCLPSNPPGGGGIRNTGTLTVTDSTIADNAVVQLDGSGISSSGPLTVINSKIVDNGAIDGTVGGISSSGPLTVFHSLIARNDTDGFGGIRARGLTVIAHSSIVDNGSFGGIGNSGTMHITDSTIARNRESGIVNFGTLTIHNSTITENDTDDEDASGIANEGGTVILLNSTIALNKAIANIFTGSVGTGAGISNAPSFANPLGGTVILQNTILAQNTIEEPSAISNDCDGPLTSLGHNLISAPTDCTITLQPSDLMGDPGLATFTDNGRPGNGHVPLLPTSQAIDVGNDAVCPRRDQLGQRRVHIPRVGTSRCDIGAIEFPGKHHRRHKENEDHHDKDHRPNEENEDHHDKDLAAAAQATP